jgi:HlyD family type I secretion membrane fusion protein
MKLPLTLPRRLRPPRRSDLAASRDWRDPARKGAGLLLAVAALVMGWGLFARLDSAVIAHGAVAAETARQTVQHLEGGIIRGIHVRDGQAVAEGELLFTLDDTLAKAALSVADGQFAKIAIREARLLAERTRADAMALTPNADAALALAGAALQDETARFQERRELRRHHRDGQEARLRAHEHEHGALDLERKALTLQLKSIDRELAPLKALLARNLVPLARVSALERERNRIDIALARASTEAAKAERAIAETRLAIAQEDADFQASVLNELIDTRRALAEIQERRTVARDALARLQVRAPLAGVAQGRRFATIGAVVKPGDALVEISPHDAPMVVKAQIDPMDIDRVSLGLRAEVRFTGMKLQEAASLFGTVRALSNDRVIEAQAQKAHYQADIEVDMAQAPKALRERIRIGMPATILVATGERSAARYVLQPLEDAFALAMRER